MFVNHRTFKIKPGCGDTAVDLLKAEIQRTNVPGTVLTPDFGPFDTVVMDIQFESLASYESIWSEWGQSPEASKFLETWVTLVEPGGSNELWVIR